MLGRGVGAERSLQGPRVMHLILQSPSECQHKEPYTRKYCLGITTGLTEATFRSVDFERSYPVTVLRMIGSQFESFAAGLRRRPS